MLFAEHEVKAGNPKVIGQKISASVLRCRQACSQVDFCLPALPLGVASDFSLQIRFGSILLRTQQPRCLPDVGQYGAKEGYGIAALDQQRRKILDIDIAHYIGLILDVQPYELYIREFFGQFFKAGTILAADVTPGGAQASHYPSFVTHDLGNL